MLTWSCSIYGCVCSYTLHRMCVFKSIWSLFLNTFAPDPLFDHILSSGIIGRTWRLGCHLGLTRVMILRIGPHLRVLLLHWSLVVWYYGLRRAVIQIEFGPRRRAVVKLAHRLKRTERIHTLVRYLGRLELYLTWLILTTDLRHMNITTARVCRRSLSLCYGL